MQNSKATVKNWTHVRLYRKAESDRFVTVYDNSEKAKVLSDFRSTRKLDSAYSFIPMTIVFHTGPFNSDRIIHALSLLWYRFNEEKGEFQRILDPESLIILSSALCEGKEVPEGCSTTNFIVDWGGIEDKSKPFNTPRFKVTGK